MDWLPLLSLGVAALKELGEGWGEVVQGIKQQSYEINFVQVLTIL